MVSGVPKAVRITRLVSRPGCGAELVERCRHIARREQAAHPDVYLVTQARRPLDGDRIELVSITQWIDLAFMATHVAPDPPTEPAFHDEYADCIEAWSVEVFEVTWPVG